MLAARAHAELRRGASAEAESFFAQAAEAEEQALAQLIPADKPRTFGITAVSAVALWYKARELQRAESLAHSVLSKPSLPTFASDQLKGLLQAIWNDAGRKFAGVNFVPEQLIVSTGQDVERAAPSQNATDPLGPISGNRVFLVHGHDVSARERAAHFLEMLHLEPVVLRGQPNAGQTIVEKVEEHGGVAFAVVLLTPDDVDAIGSKENTLGPRARQNVIFELGYFLGRLGRKHVAVLLKGDVEGPGYAGVLYIPMDDSGAWRLQLAKGLETAGLNIDLNDAMR